ncbi:MAG: Rpn family recombination-promoting nuclease/putative transposase [Lachnospiraceae bacterium]|nr:Rpn family recombination-promoting nuclease/putative transposase [Lachnospiraceae bacterium]
MKRKTTEVKSAERQPVKKGVAGVKRKGYGKSGLHNRDISSKDVFSNPVLCAQFLRDNFDIPFLQNVQPEDIEDISSRYHPYLGTEFESDSVQKIRILDIGKEKDSVVEAENEPPFLISLIDHKSLVDYDVAMQLLRYMMCIWTAYKKELEAKHEGITRRKEFRYPVIIPIVYFEGEAKWTAARNFRERISRESQFRKWIPDFRYELVNVCAYSNEELLSREDEMSLIMLINKIQNDVDLEQFLRLPGDRLNRILKNSPEHVVDVMVSVMESLCFKIDVSAEERMACVQKVRERKMGYLWENMEKFSIQEERRKTEKQRQKTEAERKKTEAERKKAEAERKKAEAERKKAEAEREKAEAEREKAEAEREKAEAEREKAEAAQKKVEEQQQLLEAERQKNREIEEKLSAAEALIKQLSSDRQEHSGEI